MYHNGELECNVVYRTKFVSIKPTELFLFLIPYSNFGYEMRFYLAYNTTSIYIYMWVPHRGNIKGKEKRLNCLSYIP